VSITSFSELKVAVADWLNRDDLSDARLGDFVDMAQNRIFHVLRIPVMEKFVAITVDTNGKIALPTDFLEAKDVLFNDKPLDRISLTEFYSRGISQGQPIAFTREAEYLRLSPNPGNVSGMKMIYYAEPPRLSGTTATNDVFSITPELYLYGALVAAGTYLGSPVEKMQIWSESFNDTMQRLVDHARQAEVSGSTNTVANGY
jgi:hypothetical protein